MHTRSLGRVEWVYSSYVWCDRPLCSKRLGHGMWPISIAYDPPRAIGGCYNSHFIEVRDPFARLIVFIISRQTEIYGRSQT